MWPRAEGQPISTNTIASYATKLYYFCGLLKAYASMITIEEGMCVH
jgi:hypothetical protein